MESTTSFLERFRTRGVGGEHITRTLSTPSPEEWGGQCVLVAIATDSLSEIAIPDGRSPF